MLILDGRAVSFAEARDIERRHVEAAAADGDPDRYMRQAAEDTGAPVRVNQVGSLVAPFFTPGPVEDFSSASRSDLDKYAAYFGEMLARGVYLAPAQFEAMFVSYAHTQGDIDQTVQAAGEAFARLYR